MNYEPAPVRTVMVDSGDMVSSVWASWLERQYQSIGDIEGDIITDHGLLSGLSDDDHAQYLNTTRHEALTHSFVDHGNLIGLGDDDHTQYFLADGSRPAATLTVSDLTGNRLLGADASNNLVSVSSLTSWISGTTNRVTVSDDGDGSVTLSCPQDIHTGASPTFAGLTLTGALGGTSAVFSGDVTCDTLNYTTLNPAISFTPGGSDTHVQFNDGGAFGGQAGFAFVKATNVLTVTGNIVSSGGYIDSSNYYYVGGTKYISVDGTNNFFAGNGAGASASGIQNIAIGDETNDSGASTGNNNITTGYRSGTDLTSGSDNCFYGVNAGRQCDSGDDNMFFGSNAGNKTEDGQRNVALGNAALFTNVSGDSNMAIGSQSLNVNLASENVAIGNTSFFSNTTGTANSGIGTASGYSNTTYSNNTYVGYNAGKNNNHQQNTYIGSQSGPTSAQTLAGGVYIGYLAGNHETASRKLFIDSYDRTTQTGARENSLVYGIFNTTRSSQLFRVNANLECTEDTYWTGDDTGVLFGEVYSYDDNGTISISLSGVANKVQIGFVSAGESNGTTPSAANDDITIDTAGRYMVSVSITINSVAGATAQFGFGVFKNNGATLFQNLHAHRDLPAGAGGNSGSVSMNGIVDVAASDTLEVWVWNETNTQNIVVDDITMSAVMVGGT